MQRQHNLVQASSDNHSKTTRSRADEGSKSSYAEVSTVHLMKVKKKQQRCDVMGSGQSLRRPLPKDLLVLESACRVLQSCWGCRIRTSICPKAYPLIWLDCLGNVRLHEEDLSHGPLACSLA